MPPTIRPNVRAMTPYQPGRPIADVRREFGLDEVVKLASNENPFGPSPLALEAIARAAADLHVYPDGASRALRDALAAHHGVEADRIVVGNGSDELIHLLGLVLLSGEGDAVIMGDPGFARYDAAAHLSAARLVKVPLDGDFRHNLRAMAAAVTERTRLVLIANPNNPTGTTVSRAEVTAFLETVPEEVAVVLDEAYFEFASAEFTGGDPEFPSSAEFLDRPNVIGLRTFSKTYGLAGIRVGYGFFPPAIADALNRAREPFDVNSLAQAAAIAALGDHDHLARTVAANRIGLDRLAEIVAAAGARPIPSRANFLLADFGRDTGPLFQALLRTGVIVRAGAPLGVPTCLRISVGTPEEIERFAEALSRVKAAV